MSKYFIGLMTGTSADSIDGCVVDFSNGFELMHSKSNDLEKNYKASGKFHGLMHTKVPFD